MSAAKTSTKKCALERLVQSESSEISTSYQKTSTTSKSVTASEMAAASDAVAMETSSTTTAAATATTTKTKKKTKKAKKEKEAEKENISVKSSFNKFDALQKKSLLANSKSVGELKSGDHVNGTSDSAANSVLSSPSAEKTCRCCSKPVFQMEQVKAERCVYHKNCFRCKDCSKQLTVDTYSSHGGQLYCKPHFKALFAPKVVEDAQPKMPRKHEMIIRENQPTELPPDVVRASDKPDLNLELEELNSLNVRSRFQVFEQGVGDGGGGGGGVGHQQNGTTTTVAVNVKRSPSILSKLAKFQRKGLDTGLPDEALRLDVEEESSEEERSDSEDDDEEEGPNGEDMVLMRARKRTARERPVALGSKSMSDIKTRFESGGDTMSGGKEGRREERKQEIQSIRSRLFMGKQAKIKEMYQQAVLESEQGITSAKKAPVLMETNDKAKSIKERFEKGEVFNQDHDEESQNAKNREMTEDMAVFDAGICKKSRSMFLELDATAAKTPQNNCNMAVGGPTASPRTPDIKKLQMPQYEARDVVKSSERAEDVIVETAEISSKFKFFETYRPQEAPRKQFRITPPREGVVKTDSPDREIYREPTAQDATSGGVNTEAAELEAAAKAHTAAKMLSLFRQMEGQKEVTPQGPKPLKRFTPPPESEQQQQRRQSAGSGNSGVTASEDEEDDEEDSFEDQPDYVKSSDKCEDEFLKQARNEARAKQLRAKFEKWESNEIRREQSNSAVNLHEELADDSQLESAKSLRDRFESMRETKTDSRTQRTVKVNRFV